MRFSGCVLLAVFLVSPSFADDGKLREAEKAHDHMMSLNMNIATGDRLEATRGGRCHQRPSHERRCFTVTWEQCYKAAEEAAALVFDIDVVDSIDPNIILRVAGLLVDCEVCVRPKNLEEVVTNAALRNAHGTFPYEQGPVPLFALASYDDLGIGDMNDLLGRQAVCRLH